MSGDWIASKLIWVVLAFAYASGRWSMVHMASPAQARLLGAGLAPLAASPQLSRRG
jgi:hypothetical protein